MQLMVGVIVLANCLLHCFYFYRFPMLSGATYDGDWLNDKFHGTGTYTSPSYTYIGMYRNGKRHGKGRTEFSNSSIAVYEGEYWNDKQHGYGTLTVKDCTYSGEWYNNVRQGEQPRIITRTVLLLCNVFHCCVRECQRRQGHVYLCGRGGV